VGKIRKSLRLQAAGVIGKLQAASFKRQACSTRKLEDFDNKVVGFSGSQISKNTNNLFNRRGREGTRRNAKGVFNFEFLFAILCALLRSLRLKKIYSLKNNQLLK
jgi:hypothetical protein